MKTINITNLKPDTYYSQPVFLDDKYILITSDIPVAEDMIERLKKWNYKQVQSDGEEGQKPSVNSMSDQGMISSNLNDDLAQEETKKEAQLFFREICGFLENIYETYKLKELISHKQILDQVKKIIQTLKEKREFILDFSSLKSTEHNFLISHSVKTTIVSIALAEFLKFPPHRTIELGMGAMMHKIGMLKINENILTKTEELKEHEWKAIQAYPILGFKILKEMEFPNTSSMAVLEHQERINGTGYPRRISGDQISLYGKILGVVSSYCAAVEKRPFKEGKNPHSGIMDILQDMGKQYDDKIVKALVFTLSVYPIGTIVQLTNKSIAVVTKTTPNNPKQPVVKVLTSENGEKLTEKIVVDLAQNNKMQIARPLTKGEIDSL